MKTFVRADFNFKDEATGILYCRGYVVCEDVQLAENGSYTFKVHSVVVQKFIGSAPDFEHIEKLAIKNCKLFDEEIIDVGSLAEHREKRKVEACKICDNNCDYCKFNCNCSTEVEI